ncbi:unnamed protein product [Amoebophrya sp. A25]|nr:unnamed protein product [Amoebophrya sp. A25]|eukprot:GSA25T00016414001.1
MQNSDRKIFCLAARLLGLLDEDETGTGTGKMLQHQGQQLVVMQQEDEGPLYHGSTNTTSALLDQDGSTAITSLDGSTAITSLGGSTAITSLGGFTTTMSSSTSLLVQSRKASAKLLRVYFPGTCLWDFPDLGNKCVEDNAGGEASSVFHKDWVFAHREPHRVGKKQGKKMTKKGGSTSGERILLGTGTGSGKQNNIFELVSVSREIAARVLTTETKSRTLETTSTSRDAYPRRNLPAPPSLILEKGALKTFPAAKNEDEASAVLSEINILDELSRKYPVHIVNVKRVYVEGTPDENTVLTPRRSHAGDRSATFGAYLPPVKLVMEKCSGDLTTAFAKVQKDLQGRQRQNKQIWGTTSVDGPVASIERETNEQASLLLRILDTIRQVLQSVHAVHESGYAHLDLKAKNLLHCPSESETSSTTLFATSSQLVLKLADFGTAKKLRSDNVRRNRKTKGSDENEEDVDHGSTKTMPKIVFHEEDAWQTPGIVSPDLASLYLQQHDEGRSPQQVAQASGSVDVDTKDADVLQKADIWGVGLILESLIMSTLEEGGAGDPSKREEEIFAEVTAAAMGDFLFEDYSASMVLSDVPLAPLDGLGGVDVDVVPASIGIAASDDLSRRRSMLTTVRDTFLGTHGHKVTAARRKRILEGLKKRNFSLGLRPLCDSETTRGSPPGRPVQVEDTTDQTTRRRKRDCFIDTTSLVLLAPLGVDTDETAREGATSIDTRGAAGAAPSSNGTSFSLRPATTTTEDPFKENNAVENFYIELEDVLENIKDNDDAVDAWCQKLEDFLRVRVEKKRHLPGAIFCLTERMLSPVTTRRWTAEKLLHTFFRRLDDSKP